MLLAASSPRCLFLSSLGAIYCAAFLSCWLQYPGILGSDGLLPASSYWLRVRQGGRGGGSTWERFCSYPSLLWLVEERRGVFLRAASCRYFAFGPVISSRQRHTSHCPVDFLPGQRWFLRLFALAAAPRRLPRRSMSSAKDRNKAKAAL